MSCDNAAHGGSDQGCNGGLMDNAFKWVSKNGLCTESDYPYTSGHGQTGTCKTDCQKVVTVTGYTDVPGESGMLAAISKGPVSVVRQPVIGRRPPFNPTATTTVTIIPRSQPFSSSTTTTCCRKLCKPSENGRAPATTASMSQAIRCSTPVTHHLPSATV